MLDDNDKRKIAYDHAIRVLKRHLSQLFPCTGPCCLFFDACCLV
jgi:hypothetical protein